MIGRQQGERAADIAGGGEGWRVLRRRVRGCECVGEQQDSERTGMGIMSRRFERR